MLRSLLTGSALVASVMLAIPAFAGEHSMPRTISLTGHGEVRLAPDVAIVNLGVSSQSAIAKDALAANTSAMQAVLAALRVAGVADNDVQTSNFMVQPRYDFNNEGKAPKLVGYEVSNSVAVVVRKLDTLGTVLDAVVQSGSNQINGIQFDVSKPDAALDEARKLAVVDARRKAEIYAAAGNLSLGNIVSISEGSFAAPPVPMMRTTMKMDAAAAVPIAQGEQALSVDVNIVWDIK